MKILFISKTNEAYSLAYGSRSGLINSVKHLAASLQKHLNVTTFIETVTDGNGIDKEVHATKPNVVVLEAIWCPIDKLRELQLLHPKVLWICRVHSKVPFLANEGIAIDFINGYENIPNTVIAFNSVSTTNDFIKMGYSAILLPNVFSQADPEVDNSIALHSNNLSFKVKKNKLNVGCFGAIRPMKNHLNQAIAAIWYADSVGLNLHFHINAIRIENNGNNVLKNLRALFANKKHKLVEWGWLSNPEFNYVIRKMDIGMQVSISESFNIVTADFVANEVPIVVTEDIEWMPHVSKSNPCNTVDMVHAIKNILSDRGGGNRRKYKTFKPLQCRCIVDLERFSKVIFGITFLISS